MALSAYDEGPMKAPGYPSADALARIYNQLDMLETALSPALGSSRNPTSGQSDKPAADPSPVMHGLEGINQRLADILSRVHV